MAETVDLSKYEIPLAMAATITKFRVGYTGKRCPTCGKYHCPYCRRRLKSPVGLRNHIGYSHGRTAVERAGL